MNLSASFSEAAKGLFDWTENPAIKHKILKDFFNAPCECYHEAFLQSDIVNELYREQEPDGNWGPLNSKDYSRKAVFPTTFVAIERCQYIGLTLEDRGILLCALDYLEDLLQDRNTQVLYNRNERAIPWQMADVATCAERLKPQNPLCDRLYFEWLYIIERAFETGEYDYEQDKAAQHEVLGTREKRLVPLRIKLILSRRENVSPKLEEALLHYFGKHAYENGHFWEEAACKLPESFQNNKMRRWFPGFNYIGQFKGSKIYLENVVAFLMESRNKMGLWDYGSQIKDPWGYFEYFQTGRVTKETRMADCSMEVLSFLNTYMNNL